MSADDRNGAAIQFVEMSEEIKGQGRGLPVETMALKIVSVCNGVISKP